jgi:hypothetical protein
MKEGFMNHYGRLKKHLVIKMVLSTGPIKTKMEVIIPQSLWDCICFLYRGFMKLIRT